MAASYPRGPETAPPVARRLGSRDNAGRGSEPRAPDLPLSPSAERPHPLPALHPLRRLGRGDHPDCRPEGTAGRAGQRQRRRRRPSRAGGDLQAHGPADLAPTPLGQSPATVVRSRGLLRCRRRARRETTAAGWPGGRRALRRDGRDAFARRDRRCAARAGRPPSRTRPRLPWPRRPRWGCRW